MDVAAFEPKLPNGEEGSGCCCPWPSDVAPLCSSVPKADAGAVLAGLEAPAPKADERGAVACPDLTAPKTDVGAVLACPEPPAPKAD